MSYVESKPQRKADLIRLVSDRIDELESKTPDRETKWLLELNKEILFRLIEGQRKLH